MATPADLRLLELLDKWLKSLELHKKYAALDERSYARIQPWPEHQRPSGWIIDIARQQAVTLQNQIRDRIKMGDTGFSDSLELMTFLANLIGSEHIERFIPLASPETERARPSAPPAGRPRTASGTATSATAAMPKAHAGAAQPSRRDSHPPVSKHLARNASAEAMREQVIADAARLVKCGRQWYELAELIAGMADRPSVPEVRRILKDNKPVIDAKTGRH